MGLQGAHSNPASEQRQGDKSGEATALTGRLTPHPSAPNPAPRSSQTQVLLLLQGLPPEPIPRGAEKSHLAFYSITKQMVLRELPQPLTADTPAAVASRIISGDPTPSSADPGSYEQLD